MDIRTAINRIAPGPKRSIITDKVPKWWDYLVVKSVGESLFRFWIFSNGNGAYRRGKIKKMQCLSSLIRYNWFNIHNSRFKNCLPFGEGERVGGVVVSLLFCWMKSGDSLWLPLRIRYYQESLCESMDSDSLPLKYCVVLFISWESTWNSFISGSESGFSSVVYPWNMLLQLKNIPIFKSYIVDTQASMKLILT